MSVHAKKINILCLYQHQKKYEFTPVQCLLPPAGLAVFRLLLISLSADSRTETSLD